jgi:hypothetical protein
MGKSIINHFLSGAKALCPEFVGVYGTVRSQIDAQKLASVGFSVIMFLVFFSVSLHFTNDGLDFPKASAYSWRRVSSIALIVVAARLQRFPCWGRRPAEQKPGFDHFFFWDFGLRLLRASED